MSAHTHHHHIHVPRGPLLGAALLLGATLLAVAAIRLSGTDISSHSVAPVVAERSLRFDDQPDGSVRVLDTGSGQLLQVVDPGAGGFLRGALRALVRERRSAGIGAETPFRLAAHADGRLTLQDPATQQRLDLESFGPANSVVFAQLLAVPSGPQPAAAPRAPQETRP